VIIPGQGVMDEEGSVINTNRAAGG